MVMPAPYPLMRVPGGSSGPQGMPPAEPARAVALLTDAPGSGPTPRPAAARLTGGIVGYLMIGRQPGLR